MDTTVPVTAQNILESPLSLQSNFPLAKAASAQGYHLHTQYR